MTNASVEHHLISETGISPNNNDLPLIHYRRAIDVDTEDPEATVENAFHANNWGDGFRGDTFPFHHYHSCAHEVVGCARGKATIQFGGPDGPVVDMEAGDAVLIPAGVVHCRLDDRPGYSAIGAYPPGQQPDLCVYSEEDAQVSRDRDDTEGLDLKVVGENEMPAIRAAITKVALPETDPVGNGAVQSLWRRS